MLNTKKDWIKLIFVLDKNQNLNRMTSAEFYSDIQELS